MIESLMVLYIILYLTACGFLGYNLSVVTSGSGTTKNKVLLTVAILVIIFYFSTKNILTRKYEEKHPDVTPSTKNIRN